MEIIIRCVTCGATTARGGLSQLPTQDEARNLAQHNPGCPISREDHRSLVHVEDVLTPRIEEGPGEEKKIVQDRKTVYTLLVFPAYRD